MTRDRVPALEVALDTDGSGLISAGEFGSFMRLAAAKPTTLAYVDSDSNRGRSLLLG